MKKMISLLCLSFILISSIQAQVSNNKIRFRYKISKEKLQKLQTPPIPLYIEDAGGTKYQFCSTLKKPFQCLLSYDPKTRVLTIDAWHIVPDDTECQQPGIISSKTPNNLRIAFPVPQTIGETTVAARFPYESWIVGINTFGVKFRPKVKDYKDSVYSPNVIAGNLNLGISAGYSFGWTNFKSNNRTIHSHSITPGLSFGFSSAALAKEPLKKNVSVLYNPSNFIFSPSVSVIFARNDLGIIFAYGRDFMFGKNAGAWAYQGKGFFGFGISAGLKL